MLQETLWGEPERLSEQSNYKGDPRADKYADHQYWERLLWNCWNMEKTLYFILHGVRCGGGELVLTKSSMKLLPGEWSDLRWEEIRQKDLGPHRDKLVEVLRTSRVMRVSNEKLPTGWQESGENK